MVEGSNIQGAGYFISEEAHARRERMTDAMRAIADALEGKAPSNQGLAALLTIWSEFDNDTSALATFTVIPNDNAN